MGNAKSDQKASRIPILCELFGPRVKLTNRFNHEITIQCFNSLRKRSHHKEHIQPNRTITVAADAIRVEVPYSDRFYYSFTTRSVYERRTSISSNLYCPGPLEFMDYMEHFRFNETHCFGIDLCPSGAKAHMHTIGEDSYTEMLPIYRNWNALERHL